MKRSILFLTGIFSFLFTLAQDYQCIRDGAEFYFTDSVLFHAIRIDSVVAESENLVYYNYSTMIWDYSIGCYSRFGPSWIGKKVTVKPDGKNIFYNRLDSTITIETLKNVGEAWTCYNFSNGNYIQAAIAEIQEMEFLTLTDSIKTITFQAYASNGTPVTHAINDKYLLLSKNYGLIRTINFKLFPEFSLNGLFYYETCSEFILYGISDPPVGKQNLNALKVFDFNEGDEIDTYREFQSPNSDYWNLERYRSYILEKEYSFNLDTVFYVVHKCGYTIQFIPFQGAVYTYLNDTLFSNHVFTYDSTMNYLPDEVIVYEEQPDYWHYSVITSNFYETSNRQMKTEWLGFYSQYPHDCIYVIDSKTGKDFGSERLYYIERLGSYFYTAWVWYGLEWSEPVYFSQGSETWGCPWAFTCESLPVNTEEFEVSEKEVTISPNPMHNWTKITIENNEAKEYQLQLFNSMGILVRDFRFQSNELVIEKEDLTEGIYFFMINDRNQIITESKLIIR